MTFGANAQLSSGVFWLFLFLTFEPFSTQGPLWGMAILLIILIVHHFSLCLSIILHHPQPPRAFKQRLSILPVLGWVSQPPEQKEGGMVLLNQVVCCSSQAARDHI